jgi:GAF domain-containing protein
VEGQRRDLLWQIIAESVEAPAAEGWAAAVCMACISVLPGVDGAALTVRADAVQETWGVSDEWVGELEQLQFTVGEGPGFEAFATSGPVLVPDLGADSGRWPGFVQAALPVGVAAMFAFPLQLGAIRLGLLDLYRRRPGRLSSRELTDAAVLANLATAAVLEQARQDKAAGDSDLSRFSGPYHDVSIATGMVAAQLEIGLAEALVRLRSRAFAEDRSVHELARDVLVHKIHFDDPNGEA